MAARIARAVSGDVDAVEVLADDGARVPDGEAGCRVQLGDRQDDLVREAAAGALDRVEAGASRRVT